MRKPVGQRLPLHRLQSNVSWDYRGLSCSRRVDWWSDIPGFAFLLHGCLDLLAAVLYIELIEQRLFGKGKDKQAEIQYSCGFVAGWLPKS